MFGWFQHSGPQSVISITFSLWNCGSLHRISVKKFQHQSIAPLWASQPLLTFICAKDCDTLDSSWRRAEDDLAYKRISGTTIKTESNQGYCWITQTKLSRLTGTFSKYKFLYHREKTHVRVRQSEREFDFRILPTRPASSHKPSKSFHFRYEDNNVANAPVQPYFFSVLSVEQ